MADGEALFNHVQALAKLQDAGKKFSQDQLNEVGRGVVTRLALTNNPSLMQALTAQNQEELNRGLNKEAVDLIKGWTKDAVKNVSQGKVAFPQEVDSGGYPPRSAQMSAPPVKAAAAGRE